MSEVTRTKRPFHGMGGTPRLFDLTQTGDLDLIDPVTMARFLVLPGAVDLLDAFSRIPEGPLREATVAQVRAMADAYSGADAAAPEQNDTLLLAALNNATPRQTATVIPIEAGRPQRQPKNLEEWIIELRMQGMHPTDIATEVRHRPMTVTSLLAEMEAGGLKFPPIKGAKPPEPKVRRKHGAPGPKVYWWERELEDLTPKESAPMRHAAQARGLTLEEYAAKVRRGVQLRVDRVPADQIQATLGENRTWVYGLCDSATLTRLMHARGVRSQNGSNGIAGMAAQSARPPAEPDWPPPYESMAPQSQAAVRTTAEEAGLTVQEYRERQRAIVQLRREGVSPAQIMEHYNLSKWQVVKLLQRARAAGVTFPDLPSWQALEREAAQEDGEVVENPQTVNDHAEA